MRKLILAVCLFGLAAPASATWLNFGSYDDGYMAFSRKWLESELWVTQVENDSTGEERPLFGTIYVKAGKLRSFEPLGAWSTGRYNYGKAKLTMVTDHGNFKAKIPSMVFELSGDLGYYEDYPEFGDRRWDERDIYHPDLVLTKLRYDAELASYLAVKRKAARGVWSPYVDGFQQGDIEMGETGVLQGRIYQYDPSFLSVDSVLLPPQTVSARFAPAEPARESVPGPSMLALAGVATVGLLRQHRRRRR